MRPLPPWALVAGLALTAAALVALSRLWWTFVQPEDEGTVSSRAVATAVALARREQIKLEAPIGAPGVLRRMREREERQRFLRRKRA